MPTQSNKSDAPGSGKSVVIVAGEASGDAHAARMVNELKALDPNITFRGMGGDRLREAGVDIFIDNLGVSGRHARLWWERGRFMISDLGSSNGTAVNGRRIDSAAIGEGDDIRIGKFRLRIEEEEQEPQVPETHLIMANGPNSTYWLASSGGRHRIDRDLFLVLLE